MSFPNQYPTHEYSGPLSQRFDGQIIDEYKKEGLIDIHTPVLRATIDKEDSLVIDPESVLPGVKDFMGAPVVAKLELGGYNSKPTEVQIAKVDPTDMSEKLKSFLAYVELPTGDEESKPFYVVAVADQRAIDGFTIIRPTTKFGLFGRAKNNMSWFDAHGKPYSDEQAGSAISNDTVSRKHLLLSFDESGGIRINGQTDRSDTVVTTVANDEHRRVLNERIAAKDTEEVPVDKSVKAGNRISRLLASRRQTKK